MPAPDFTFHATAGRTATSRGLFLGRGAGAGEERGQALCEGRGIVERRAFGDQCLVVQKLDPGRDIAGFLTITAL